MLPLVAQRLTDNVAALCYSVADMLPRRWHAVRELHCDARHKLACMAYVAATAREEEAGRKTLPIVVPARHRPGNGRLARARQAVQPEDAPLVLTVHPAVCLVKEVDARVGKAGRLVLLRVRVEGRVNSVRQPSERVLGTCVAGCC